MQGRFILAADIGGTFSRFALFRLEKRRSELYLSLLPESRIKLATQESPSFSSLLSRLGSVEAPGGYTILPAGPRPGYEILGAVMAVPGPVEHGRCLAANIPWALDKRDIEAVFGIPADLINDFAAQAYACLFPDLLGLHCILSGQSKGHSPISLVGAGTGLGSALLLPDMGSPAHNEKFYAGHQGAAAQEIAVPPNMAALHQRVLPSEGGHAVFGFVGDDEAAFEAFMRQRSGRREAIGDMVVTGYGLSMLHAFYSGAKELLPPPEVSRLIDKHPAVLECFARFYGRACRNFVLSTLSLGGLYLSGGLLSHLPGLLGHPAFAAEFLFSETKAYLLKEIPVFWISNQNAGLWGSAVAGLRFVV